MSDVSEVKNKQRVASFEGGAIYTGEMAGTPVLIIDESATYALLSQDDQDGVQPWKVVPFSDVQAREAYLQEKYLNSGEESMQDPFLKADTLSHWTAKNLEERGIDEIANWRMLEYWFQVEVFRLIQTGKAGPWRHVGDYEQPYHTELPRSGSKTKTKWIDLVVAKPDPDAPDTLIWIELKDVGRSRGTAVNNARGLGHDLAALWKLDPRLTQELWLDPQPHSMDRGRLEEWNKHGPGLGDARHLIAQIVISPKAIDEALPPDVLANTWLDAFMQRVGDSVPDQSPTVARASTNKFHVFTLVAELPR